jgi:hypothetical protein
LCLRPMAWWRAGASSFELLRYLFTNALRQIVVVDYASRLVVEYHVTGIFPAATGPAVMGDVLNFQPSHNLEKNEQAKKNQKNLAATPRDKAPRSAPHLFQSLIVGWQCGVPLLSNRIQSCAAMITKRADAVTFQMRSGHGIIASLPFAFANELRHCRGKGATDLGKGLRPIGTIGVDVNRERHYLSLSHDVWGKCVKFYGARRELGLQDRDVVTVAGLRSLRQPRHIDGDPKCLVLGQHLCLQR